MNLNRVEHEGRRYGSKVVEHWDKPSQDDFAEDPDCIQGRRDKLDGKLQKAYGISRDQAKKDVDEFCKSL